jgi:hypothetical protein
VREPAARRLLVHAQQSLAGPEAKPRIANCYVRRKLPERASKEGGLAAPGIVLSQRFEDLGSHLRGRALDKEIEGILMRTVALKRGRRRECDLLDFALATSLVH